MKRAVVITLLGLACIVICVVVSCDLFAMSIPLRVSALEDSLNVNGTRNIIQHFHPDMVGYALYGNEDEFILTELASDLSPFTITLAGSPQDIGGGLMAQSGTLSNDNAPNWDIDFEFLEDGPDNWKIIFMQVDNGNGGTWQ